MTKKQAQPQTKGVSVKLLAALDLGPEIEGMAGRQLRMRMVTIEPGGVFGPIHDHKDRPGLVYILQGTITDHRNGMAKRQAGVGSRSPDYKGIAVRSLPPLFFGCFGHSGIYQPFSTFTILLLSSDSCLAS